jgi:hypothetical protein
VEIEEMKWWVARWFIRSLLLISAYNSLEIITSHSWVAGEGGLVGAVLEVVEFGGTSTAQRNGLITYYWSRLERNSY